MGCALEMKFAIYDCLLFERIL